MFKPANPNPLIRLMACLFLCTATVAGANPIQLDLTGSVTSAGGVWSGDSGSAFTVSTMIDLDEGNAYDIEPRDDSTLYYFIVPTYGGSFSGDLGSLTVGTPPTQDVVNVEAIGDFDLDANGNPFGETGIVDILNIFASSIIVDCSGGIVDPVTGCSDPEAPFLSGDQFEVLLVGPSDWFDGNDLPASIPEISELVAIYGTGETWGAGSIVGTADLEFTTLSITGQASPVPSLGPIGLTVLSGLFLALPLLRREGRWNPSHEKTGDGP